MDFKHLNKNSLVSLNNDKITLEKIKTNTMKNSNIIFLRATNQASDNINQFFVETLFQKQLVIAIIINYNRQVIDIYRDEAVIIRENRCYQANFFISVNLCWRLALVSFIIIVIH